jgi:hypothetical protein
MSDDDRYDIEGAKKEDGNNPNASGKTAAERDDVTLQELKPLAVLVPLLALLCVLLPGLGGIALIVIGSISSLAAFSNVVFGFKESTNRKRLFTLLLLIVGVMSVIIGKSLYYQ